MISDLDEKLKKLGTTLDESTPGHVELYDVLYAMAKRIKALEKAAGIE